MEWIPGTVRCRSREPRSVERSTLVDVYDQFYEITNEWVNHEVEQGAPWYPYEGELLLGDDGFVDGWFSVGFHSMKQLPIGLLFEAVALAAGDRAGQSVSTWVVQLNPKGIKGKEWGLLGLGPSDIRGRRFAESFSPESMEMCSLSVSRTAEAGRPMAGLASAVTCFLEAGGHQIREAREPITSRSGVDVALNMAWNPTCCGRVIRTAARALQAIKADAHCEITISRG